MVREACNTVQWQLLLGNSRVVTDAKQRRHLLRNSRASGAVLRYRGLAAERMHPLETSGCVAMQRTLPLGISGCVQRMHPLVISGCGQRTCTQRRRFEQLRLQRRRPLGGPCYADWRRCPLGGPCYVQTHPRLFRAGGDCCTVQR